MTKIYIASRWMSQPRLRNMCHKLDGLVTITSRWINADRPEEPTAQFFKDNGLERAKQDIDDIKAADWLVLDLLDGRGRRGGMMFETGLACGIGKRVIVIGDRDCVFTQLFQSYDDWDQFIDYLKGRFDGL